MFRDQDTRDLDDDIRAPPAAVLLRRAYLLQCYGRLPTGWILSLSYRHIPNNSRAVPWMKTLGVMAVDTARLRV